MDVRGRADEHAELERIVDAARRGHSGVRVVRGPVGVGKTALLNHVTAAACGMQVSWVNGVEAEQGWSFAALHQLLQPFLGEVDAVPAAQREALSVAFGITCGAPPELGLVGSATLALLARAADTSDETGVVCVIDDAQWLDDESLSVLASVAHRLGDSRIALLIGTRPTGDQPSPLAALPHLEVPPLSSADAASVVADELAAAGFDQVLAGRILAEARGNPLALKEFARHAGVDALTPGAPLPLNGRLMNTLHGQLPGTCPQTMSVLLLVAAADTRDLAVISEAIDGGDEVDLSAALEEAVSSGLLAVDQIDQKVEFQNPLLRSAVYSAAPPGQRRAAHAALAAALDPVDDTERRAWQWAAASAVPDESRADLLEHVAARAAERGDPLTQASALTRAAELSHPGGPRNRRLRAASKAAITADAPRLAKDLLGRCTPSGDPLEAAADLHLRGLAAAMLDCPEAVQQLVSAAASQTTATTARRILLEALDASIFSTHGAAGPSPLSVARMAASTSRPPGRPATSADLLLDGMASLIQHGLPAAAPTLTDALGRGVPTQRSAVNDPEPAGAVRLRCLAAVELWNEEALSIWSAASQVDARRDGNLPMARAALHGLGLHHVYCGQFDAAALRFAEISQVLASPRVTKAPREFGTALLDAWIGDETETRTALDALGVPPDGANHQFALAAAVILDISRGRYDDARELARSALDGHTQFGRSVVLPDLIEAAVRTGKAELAQQALAALTERATAAGTPWALGVLNRGRALVAPGDEPEGLYRTAIARLERTAVVTDLARTYLLYGEWLRRQRRRTDARAPLRSAHDLFVRMGAATFSERTRIELLATGERARKRTEAACRDLTPQELSIARLAASGATNSEIATTLFISASTVDHHLRKVYRKLDINSRSKLMAALAD